MPQSMTAFARCAAQTPLGDLTWEVRSVNHRYREVALRLPEELRFAEGVFREAIAVAVSRGRVDAQLRYLTPALTSTEPDIDTGVVDRLATWSDHVRAIVPDARPLQVSEILKWPGVISTPALDDEALALAASTLLQEALDELTTCREREGNALADILKDKTTAARDILGSLAERLPDIGQAQRQRLEQRLAEMLEQVDPDRLEQEIVILLARSEVSEEMDRLSLHLDEVEQALSRRGPVGRRLDFLMQELNREANTLGSKSAHSEQTSASVSLKVLIEQMREQVQNIE